MQNLVGLADAQDERAREFRQIDYNTIRDLSGLEFEGWGDEPERWLAWMRENDTLDKKKASQIRDENRRLQRKKRASKENPDS